MFHFGKKKNKDQVIWKEVEHILKEAGFNSRLETFGEKFQQEQDTAGKGGSFFKQVIKHSVEYVLPLLRW